jgi:glycosyltransferase involved in cell wall biosynthesis
MDICVISFDFWQYDGHIVEVLRKKGINAHHINLGAYQHKNIGARAKNALSKIFLKKNLKKQQRQELILEQLRKYGRQNQILVINPEQIDRAFHIKIKEYTDRYIAYLYDSLARNPAEHVLDLFDTVFSFDRNDSETHGFQLITNYNYLEEQTHQGNTTFDLVYLASFDDRLKLLYKITEKLTGMGRSYYYVIVGKKTWKKEYLGKGLSNRIYTRKRIKHEDIAEYYNKGKVLLDLVRNHQDGLSFRILEAMALKKKVITDNRTIVDYDLYNPKNILVLQDDLSNLTTAFFETDYEELPADIYNKYTLESWVKTVFELK